MGTRKDLATFIREEFGDKYDSEDTIDGSILLDTMNAAEKFADQEKQATAIAFADFIRDKEIDWSIIQKGNWVDKEDKYYTTDELYQLYITSKK